uniref:Uncharacterized protein n=1 Tax=Arundo donax TaxID=35708 RepID=A0A0A9A0D4_ARUDO
MSEFGVPRSISGLYEALVKLLSLCYPRTTRGLFTYLARCSRVLPHCFPFLRLILFGISFS